MLVGVLLSVLNKSNRLFFKSSKSCVSLENSRIWSQSAIPTIFVVGSFIPGCNFFVDILMGGFPDVQERYPG